MDSLRKHSIGAFTLIELLIVIAIIGIIAALAIPEIQDRTQQTKEAAAMENLRLFRNAIEQYAAQHKGVPPGYPNGDMSKSPVMTTVTQQLCGATNSSGAVASIGTAGYPLGPYLLAIPKNPLNDKNNVQILINLSPFPASATGVSGWVYKPFTKTIKLNYVGTDSTGVSYYDY